MTCIIAMEYEGKVYMGCDSMSADGWNIRPTSLPKVFSVGEFLIGYTSSFRMGQLLQYHLVVREREENESELKYMVVGFVDAVRSCLKDGGYAKVENNQEEMGAFLVGYRGKVYSIEADFQANHFQDGIAALGCGASFAIATLATLLDVTEEIEPENIIMKSLEMSARFSGGVLEPFFVTCS